MVLALNFVKDENQHNTQRLYWPRILHQVLHELTGTDELYVDCEVVNLDDHCLLVESWWSLWSGQYWWSLCQYYSGHHGWDYFYNVMDISLVIPISTAQFIVVMLRSCTRSPVRAFTLIGLDLWAMVIGSGENFQRPVIEKNIYIMLFPSLSYWFTRLWLKHCTMIPLLTRSCLKSSKLRPILNGQFCHAISKNIGLNLLGSKQPREILVFVILKL